MAKVSQIDKAIADFERQRDILQQCIEALTAQRAQWNPKKLHAAKTVRHRLDAGTAVTGSVQSLSKKEQKTVQDYLDAKAKESAS